MHALVCKVRWPSKMKKKCQSVEKCLIFFPPDSVCVKQMLTSHNRLSLILPPTASNVETV